MPAPGRLRVVASARDYALISAWIALLTLAGVVARFLVPTAGAAWELAHLAVARLIVGVDLSRAVWATYALSLLLPAASIAMAWREPVLRK